MVSEFYFSKRGYIESYSAKPKEVLGSVTITNGIKIEAVCSYIHHFSIFDVNYFGQDDCPRYFFSYQIRISGPPAINEINANEEIKQDESNVAAGDDTFYPC